MQNKLNALANVCLIAASLMTAAVVGPALFRTYFVKRPPRPTPIPDYVVGQSVDLPGLEKGRSNIVFALSPECGICVHDASNGVYEHAGAAAGTANIVVISPSSASEKETKAFLSTYHVPGKSVIMPAERFPFAGTPYTLLIDTTGKVTGAWKGAIDQERERQLLTQIATLSLQGAAQ